MATNVPQDDFHKTGLRIPRDLHQRLHEAAAQSARSYNSEIIARLQASFEHDERLQAMFGALSEPDDHQREVLDALEQLRHEVSQLRAQLKREK